MMQMQNNNPMAMIMSAMRSGKTPRALIQEMAINDPRAQMAAQMMNGKSEKELEQLVRNMAAERGIALEDLARSMGIQIPSQR